MTFSFISLTPKQPPGRSNRSTWLFFTHTSFSFPGGSFPCRKPTSGALRIQHPPPKIQNLKSGLRGARICPLAVFYFIR